jgi:hypothetical protein
VTGGIERITRCVASWFVLFAECSYDSQITEGGMGGVCSAKHRYSQCK